MIYKKIINRLYKMAFHPPNFDKTIKFLFKGKKEICLIDIGANKGQTIDWALNLFDKAEIYSFEPTSELFLEIRAKYERFSAVHISNLAMSNYNGTTKFYTSSYSMTNSLLKPKMDIYKKLIDKAVFEKMNNQFEETVDVMKFDDWYAQNLKDMKIDILKIDTQGNDHNVLFGAVNSLNNISVIIIEIEYLEFYEGAIPFYKIIEFLMEHGFIVYSIFDNTRNSNGHLIESNFIFVKDDYFKNTLKQS